MRLVVDIEANNLLNNSSIDYTASPYKLKDTFRIWCIVTKDIDTKEIRVFKEDQIISEFVPYFKQATSVIAHNGINYDLLVLKLYAGLDYEVEPDKIAGNPVEIINKLRPISGTIFVVQAKSDLISPNQFRNNVTILNDKDEKLGEYGLGNATHYLFILKNKKMVYWNYLDNNHINEINEASNKLD